MSKYRINRKPTTEVKSSYDCGWEQARFEQEYRKHPPKPIENGGVRGEVDTIVDYYKDINGSLTGWNRREAIKGWNSFISA